MNKFKVGDKVRIIDRAQKIFNADNYVHTVLASSSIGDVTISGSEVPWAQDWLELYTPNPIVGDTVRVTSTSRPEINGEVGVLEEIAGIRYAVRMSTGAKTGELAYTNLTSVEKVMTADPDPVEETYTFTATELAHLQSLIKNGAGTSALTKIKRKINPTEIQTFTVTLEVEAGVKVYPGMFDMIRDPNILKVTAVEVDTKDSTR